MSQHENPTRTDAGPTGSLPNLPATLRLGAVHLTVTGLDRSVAFYEDAIGLRLHRREGRVAAMSIGEQDLLVLYEEPEARRVGRHAGPLPLRAAPPFPRGAGARGAAARGDADPDAGRLRPRHPRGHLPP
jgi:catechol 2,3-dioxygenase-like lactoylglutathione lyase family enzyme